MAQIFHPSTNVIAKATIFGAVFLLAALGWAAGILVRSAYVTGVDEVRDQPVPFSHDHHVSGLGLDCRYCHTSVEKSAFAGLPATEVCMGCHSQIWRDSPLLAPVRDSFRTGRPLAWTRVHNVADYVYFNHRIHIAKGVGCECCHGRVDRMPLMGSTATLHMEWCLECHRHPEQFVRNQRDIYRFGLGEPRDDGHAAQVTESDETERGHPAIQAQRGERATAGALLVQQYGIATGQLTDCAVCHR